MRLVPQIKTYRSNAAIELVLGELRRAHERAVDERRIYRVTFTAPGTIQLDVGKVAVIGSTITNSAPLFAPAQTPLTLPGGVQFAVVPGIPTNPGATPDGLGTGANAIDFALAGGGGGNQIFFQPAGRALYAANRLTAALVYLTQPTTLF